MIYVKSPDRCDISSIRPRIFLAGSIEQGLAEEWQRMVAEEMKDVSCVVYNPRRDEWDPTWEQDPSPGTPFTGQVTWELSYLSKADVVIFYFDPNTQSVISLLELGFCVGMHKRMFVCCPDGYFRKGNIVLTCNINQTPVFNDLQSMISEIKATFGVSADISHDVG